MDSLFRHKRGGFFVEIGAYNGETAERVCPSPPLHILEHADAQLACVELTVSDAAPQMWSSIPPWPASHPPSRLSALANRLC